MYQPNVILSTIAPDHCHARVTAIALPIIE